MVRNVALAPAFTRHYVHMAAPLGGRLLAEADVLGAPAREYVWIGDLPLALIDHGGTSPVVYYVHADHLGTPRKMTDASRALVWDGVFRPFGEAHSLAGAAANDNRFPGQFYQLEAGYHQNWHRDYDPSLGRYLQSDPLGLVDGPNTYAYVRGNPISFADPSGLYRWPEDIFDDAMRDAQSSALPGPHNGPQDAFRHCVASCETRRENGTIAAQCLGWANEKKGDWTRSQEVGERAMDDHNNALGIALGGSAASYQDCKNMCMNAVNAGQTINSYQPGSTPPYSFGSAY